MRDTFATAIAVLFSLGGGGAIVLGLSSWLGKVWASRILEGERARYSEQLAAMAKQLDHQLHSTNKIFDAEFDRYREVWAVANRLRELAINVRSATRPSVLTPEQEAARRRNFQAILFEFQDLIDSHKPFLAPEIYDAFMVLQAHAGSENARATAHRDLEGMALGRSHMEGVVPIMEAAEEACRLIRERIWSARLPVSTSASIR